VAYCPTDAIAKAIAIDVTKLNATVIIKPSLNASLCVPRPRLGIKVVTDLLH